MHHGKKPGGIWKAIMSLKKPRDLIPRLKIPETTPPQYERSSVRMANLARDAYDRLQRVDIDDGMELERNAQINKTLAFVPGEQTISKPNASPMHHIARTTQVESVLKLSKNGSATGLDGCLYELWKALNT
ncbi:hypothetical protein BJV74DRAFT_800292 [Russula compacta]|nr:hypothetical protein BJV74DRAFT_800292 [Russula compacta]